MFLAKRFQLFFYVELAIRYIRSWTKLLMKMGFSGVILLRYSFIFVLVSLSLGICVVATADGTRFVPQLALHRFNPTQVVYHPREPLLLVTDGVNSRIDIVNVS